jgi:Fic family protein
MAPWTKAQLALRNAHLKTFYGPYFGHLTARTPEYIELGKSGLVWDRIYKLRNITPWKTAERTLTRRLQEIDTLRETLKQGVGNRTSDRSFANFVSKSCEIEHNSLSVSDALRLSHLLTEGSIFSSNPILSTVEMELPSAENLALSLGHPPARTQEVLELRNHIFALKAALSDECLRREETPESLLEDVRNLSRILLRDTALAKTGHASGQYRQWPIRVTSSLYTIFPYAEEVPANMVRWSEWTTTFHDDQLVHPLIKAVWMTLYYLSVHPFYDGNGRLSRTLMAVRMAKNGFVPAVCSPGLKRDEYIAMVQAAHDGQPEALCREVVCAATCELQCLLQQ